MAADGLAPIGARPSVVTVRTKFRICICMGQPLQSLKSEYVQCLNYFLSSSVYDFKYFQALPFGLLEFEDRLNFIIAMYINDIKKTETFQWPCRLQEFKLS